MQHDACMRAAVRAIYEAVYPSEEWTPAGFEEAERHGTIHYRQAVEALRCAQRELREPSDRQLALL